MIKILNVSKTYETKDRTVKALDNINVEFPDRGMVFILGKSGSGKTTLMNLIGGLDKADFGKIQYIDSRKSFDVLQLNDVMQEEYRNLIMGYIFQDFNLISNCNVEENIKFVLEQQNIEGVQDISIDDKVRDIIKYVELEGMEKSKISDLSGGQIQRVAIARAVVKNSNVILADEPTGNLDYKTGLKIMELLKNISKRCLIIVVTHDENLANMFGDKIINISNGMIESEKLINEDNIEYRISIEKSLNEKYNEIFNSKRAAMLFLENIIFNDKYNSVNVIYEEIYKNSKENDSIKTINKAQSKLGFKRLLKFAYLNFKEFKLKNIINTIVMGILFGIFCFVCGLIFSNKIYSETKYVSDNLREIVFKQNKEYKDDFDNLIENIIYSSEDILWCVDKYIDEKQIIESYSEVEIKIGENYNIVDIWIDYQDYELLEGKKPDKENEICITDFIAELMFENNEAIGCTVDFFNTKFVVSGIIKTDFIETDIINKMEKGQLTPTEYDSIKYIYQRCICNKDILNYLNKSVQVIEIEASDFTLKGKTSYINSDLMFSSALNFSDNDYLIYGRKPEKTNEIMVSYEFAIINNMINEEGFECKEEWAFIDIYDKKFNEAYINYVNLFDYLSEFKIVGVVDNYNGEFVSDIFLYDNMFRNIKNVYFDKTKDMKVFSLNHIDNKELENILYRCQEKDITIDEGVVEVIDGFFESKNNMSYLFVAIMIVFAVIVFMLNISNIVDNIDLHKRNIGIMKALGVNKKELHKIFYIQSTITTFVLILIGLITMFIINYISNIVLNIKLETNNICYFGGEKMYLFVIVLAFFMFNMIYIKFLMRRIDKIKIIKLIKD
ncbi:MAG: ABC transporter ATP-binding protein/permease [Lachnospiraceae bacterium]|nr:ABC transporter ATP-binding protein/permease [Lachnospiraceae bacterium]